MPPETQQRTYEAGYAAGLEAGLTRLQKDRRELARYRACAVLAWVALMASLVLWVLPDLAIGGRP